MAHLTLSARLIKDPTINDKGNRVQLTVMDTTVHTSGATYFISVFEDDIPSAMDLRKSATVLIEARQTRTWDPDAKQERLDIVLKSLRPI